MDGDYRLEAMSVPESLDELHDLIERVGQDHPGVSATDLSLLETAIIELAGNVVEHGRPEGGVQYRFVLDVREDCLVAELSEPGAPVEISESVPDGMAETGRGLLLARAVTDELTHHWEHGVNTWTVVRRRRPDPT